MNTFRDTLNQVQQRIGTSYETDQLAFRMLYENAYLDRHRRKHRFSNNLKCPTDYALRTNEAYRLSRDYARDSNENLTSKKRILILCNDFISEENLYVSPFLYRRIKKYQERGLHVDVIAYAKTKTPKVYEFDGITILNGYVNELTYLLATQKYNAVAVHFFNAEMWSVVRNYRHRHKFHLFLHGYEIRNWTRSFDPLSTLGQVQNAISRSLLLKDFWRHILEFDDFPASYVFVSDWMKRSAEEDVGSIFPPKKAHVIHNFIETDLYAFSDKHPDMRFKILMIRNFDKFQYGTDIALEVLKLLRRDPIWQKVSVSIFGEGKGLQEFIREFSDQDNVSISKGYLSQSEMAEQHKQHGVFLVPTRFDSQGVARDEAMSSGLVPVTNSVCAIPEFVHEGCALISPPEDAHSMYRNIVELLGDAELFRKLSRAANERVEATLSEQHTIGKELELFLS